MSDRHPFLEIVDGPSAPRTDAPVVATHVAAPGDPAVLRYAAAALEAECAKVTTAVEGTRNHTLNTAAFSLGQLVAAGHLTAALVMDRLVAAAQACGLPLDEINRTITHALKDGETQPRLVQLNHPHHTTDDTTFTAPAGKDTEGFHQAVDGERFIFEVRSVEPAIWGDGDRVLWSPGEATIITGPPGVGKTTVVQQLVMARIGLTDKFLGFPVIPTGRKVLYLAMDRPRQIARSMRRMVDDGDRELLAERLVVWQGPLPRDVAASPDVLLSAAEFFDADTLIVDSVKDAAVGLADTEKAGMYNRARQRALAGGVDMIEIAHQVKRGNGGSPPKTLQDVHGGMELTAGAGSVFLIWGEAGDLVVEFRHLKQPAEMIGPLSLVHDHDAGRTTIEDMPDAADLLRHDPGKAWTAVEVAGALMESGKPSRGDIERMRRKLEKLASSNLVTRAPGLATGGGKTETRYMWVDRGATTTWSPP